MRFASIAVRALLFVALFAPCGMAQQVVFQRRAAQPGDTSNQQLVCDLDLEMSIRQGTELIQSQQQLLKRKQNRRLTILQSAAGAPSKARVSYEKSVITVMGPEQQTSSAQPVTGKSYLITRDGEELTVTNADGTPPSEAELAIVTGNMGSFGLPNPIAQFFHGRSVNVGETLELPVEMARDLVGFAETGNTVSAFRMKLERVQAAAKGRPEVAVFAVQLHADDPDKSGVTMNLEGEMHMEVATCRSTNVQLTGAVAASESHGPPKAQYRLHSEGEIRVAVKADYVQR